ncbi:MAG: tetraacyldisaccharide 4'-kinase [Bacteroidia bacterium]|nr:tetraacyldisaccharide 4'-kinase [Bacteroidia bacterium]
MKFLRILLFPFSLIYGSIVFLRNKLFDWKLLSSKSFAIPTISVGNLSVGGTGKTPHIEYIIRLLKPDFYIATLSRGYGRKTSGLVLADTQSTSSDIGDEPLQFKKKFSGIRVAVDEKRVRGVASLIKEFPSLQCVLLDDAFQHRQIKTGLSILLTDFAKLYTSDFMVPTGALREFRMGAKRADIIIVTKCPDILLPIERKRLLSEINPLPHQKVYFSYIKYGNFISLNSEDTTTALTKEFYFERNYTIALVTGIANTKSLEYYLKHKVKNIVPVKFADHHHFNKSDIETIKKIFNNIATANKIILTTEKDAMRLKTSEFSALLKDIPLFYIPIEIEFHDKDKKEFNEQVVKYVRSNQKYS